MTLGLEISFHDDCDKKAENCQRPRFWDCARIDGFISLSDAATRTFDVVEVVLEGTVKTWIKHEECATRFSCTSVARQRVLHMTAVKPRESFVQRAADASHGKWYSSFRFDISHMPIELFSDSDPALCPYIPSPTLPPSFDTETVDFEALNFETYDQGGCQVAYTLHARCLLGNVCVAEISREIDVVPRAQPLPPLDTSDYPGEYRLKGSKALRKRFVQKQIGQLSVTTMEPAPLQIDQSKDTTSTKINLEFRFHQASAGSLAGPPEFSHCVVFSRLRSCTFVSTLQRSSMPTQQQLDNVPSLLRIVRHKPIQTRESHFPRWRGVLQDESHHCANSSDSRIKCWETDVSVIIAYTTNTIQLPTFASSLLNRRYSLGLKINLKGRRNMTFNLEIPIQVAHQKFCQVDYKQDVQYWDPLLDSCSLSANHECITPTELYTRNLSSKLASLDVTARYADMDTLQDEEISESSDEM